MKQHTSPLTVVYTALLRVLAAVYGVLTLFWSYILIQTALFQSSSIAIDTSGVQYFQRASVGIVLVFLCIGALMGSWVLLLLAAIKRHPARALCWTAVGLLIAGSLMFLCIPPQIYATSAYLLWRTCGGLLPGWVFSPFLLAGVAGGCVVCLLLKAGQKAKATG